jgi:hypothetical protein
VKKQRGKMWEESVFTYPKQFSELHQEKYVPLARRSIIQLQTSTSQPSLAKPFAEIRSKIVPSLSLFGVVTKMEYGPGKTDMTAICCRQLFTAISTVFEKSKEAFVRSALPDQKKKTNYVVGHGERTDTEDIKELKLNVTNYVMCY